MPQSASIGYSSCGPPSLPLELEVNLYQVGFLNRHRYGLGEEPTEGKIGIEYSSFSLMVMDVLQPLMPPRWLSPGRGTCLAGPALIFA